MEKREFTIGVDVSKATLDLHCLPFAFSTQISNDAAGFKVLIKWFKSLKVYPNNSVVILEFTGAVSYTHLTLPTNREV